jgi:micrococcal nuclease
VPRVLFLVSLILLVPSVILNIFLLSRRKTEETYTVSRVVDGDTVILAPGDIRARLANVEAPEIEFCGGQEAMTRLRSLAEGQRAKVVFGSDDNFNRSLVHVFIAGKMVNRTLLEEGLVRYDGSPSPYRDELRDSYQKALADKLGIFGRCRETAPSDPKCVIKGNIDKQTPRRTYFFPGCNEYERTVVEKDRGEKWFCTEKQAQAEGYAKGGNCPDKF